MWKPNIQASTFCYFLTSSLYYWDKILLLIIKHLQEKLGDSGWRITATSLETKTNKTLAVMQAWGRKACITAGKTLKTGCRGELSILAEPYRFFSQSRRAFESQSYCLRELENAERPSVLGGVHRDEPSLFLLYISTYSMSPHILCLHILYISPHTLYIDRRSLCSLL